MGRWGFQMLHGDTDNDIVTNFEDDLLITIRSEDPIQDWTVKKPDPDHVLEVRKTLDEGKTQELYRKYREEGAELAERHMVDKDYILCVLTAFPMYLGAKVPVEEREYLKKAMPKFEGAVGYRMPLFERDFRAHGKAQFTASLEYYINGQQRDLFEPCCANCGKLKQDLGGATLKKCTKCPKGSKNGMYCNKECQKTNWKDHKVICEPRRGLGLNV